MYFDHLKQKENDWIQDVRAAISNHTATSALIEQYHDFQSVLITRKLQLRSEFYNVSIPEIIDGERKSEKMNEEVKETVLKLSDYAETINQKIKIKLFWLTIAALLGMIAFLVIETLGLNTPDSLYEYIASAGLGLDFGMLIVIAMYLSGVLGKIKARRMKLKNIH